MLYHLDHKDGLEKRIVEQARRTGQPLPDRVENAPELDQGLMLYWVAYCDLSTCRPASFGGVAPIPWTAINQYSEFYGLDDEQSSRLHLFVGKMDKAMEAWHERKRGKEQKSVGTGKKNKRSRGWNPRRRRPRRA